MAKDYERVRRDQAGVGPDPSHISELVSLDDLHNFKVADGEPDVRGWEVCTVAGKEIGEVEDLLVDPRRGEIVMLDVDIKDSDLHAEVPLRAVQLDHSRKLVIVDSGEVHGYVPPTRRERLGAAGRDRLRDIFSGTKRHQVRYDLRDRDVSDIDERDIDARRMVDDGTVEETVVESKPVVMEEVVVRRRTVDASDDPLDSESRRRRR